MAPLLRINSFRVLCPVLLDPWSVLCQYRMSGQLLSASWSRSCRRSDYSSVFGYSFWVSCLSLHTLESPVDICKVTCWAVVGLRRLWGTGLPTPEHALCPLFVRESFDLSPQHFSFLHVDGAHVFVSLCLSASSLGCGCEGHVLRFKFHVLTGGAREQLGFTTDPAVLVRHGCPQCTGLCPRSALSTWMILPSANGAGSVPLFSVGVPSPLVLLGTSA